MITLPYPLLLQKSAREALDISLKDHVVIIDEAHNLLDAISSIHSSSISLSQLQLGRAQLGGYLLKFRNRLRGKNRVYVTQLVRLIDCLKSFLETKAAEDNMKKEDEAEVVVGDLMAGKGVDQINLYKLMRYLQESKIARKVERYAVFEFEQQSTSVKPMKTNGSAEQPATRTEKEETATGGASSTMPVLTQLHSFLLALTYPEAEGRFFYERLENGDVMLKYLLLDPTAHFREIVDEARAVILAGGTMSPVSTIPHFLFILLVVLPCLSSTNTSSDGRLHKKPPSLSPIIALTDSLMLPRHSTDQSPSYASVQRSKRHPFRLHIREERRQRHDHRAWCRAN